MKKVLNITIGGVVFTVEEDAYELLSNYLKEIGNHFKKDEDREEIVEDIEVSIAEKFMAKKGAVVSSADVKRVIKKMGSTKDFKDFANEEVDDESEEKPLPRKLYRDEEDEIIAGVASGLAAYFGVDALFVRLVFFISLFLGGVGFLAYVFLWIVVPPAQTTAQRLHMRGERVTLKEIEKSVKAGVDRLKKKDLKRVSAVLARFFGVVGNLLRIFGGAFSLILGVFGVFAVSFALAWMISGGVIPYSNFVLYDFLGFSEPVFLTFMMCLYYIILFPLLVFILFGFYLLKKKVLLRTSFLVIFLVIWFVALGLVASLGFQNLEHMRTMVQGLL